MKLEERILLAQKDARIRGDLIAEYKGFIFSCAKKTAHRYICEQDDEASVAMIAFDEAITKYSGEKGTFLNFAGITIRNRLIDFMRTESKAACAVPFSGLSQTGKNGEEIPFDAEDAKSVGNDAKYELEALCEELSRLGISFFDLPKCTPKSKKTKAVCFEAVRRIISDEALLRGMKKSANLPIAELSSVMRVHRKVLERHRKYIIAAAVILTGGYEVVSEYFKAAEEVSG